jgi:hypothetical protein
MVVMTAVSLVEKTAATWVEMKAASTAD